MTPFRTAGLLALASAVCLAAAAPGPAADVKTGFVNRKHKDDEYVVFVPHDYDGKKEFPVILFLHGAGEVKGKGGKPVEVGIGPAIKRQEKSFKFITVIPQAQPAAGAGWKADGSNGKRAMTILADVMKDYKTDPTRVYLTGMSLGGGGTWSLAAAHPEKWAAIAPVCGHTRLADAKKLKDLPCWCFHGDKDDRCPVSESRDMIAALKTAGGSPNYTEYEGVGHDAFDRAYANPKLYTWLLSHKKK